MFEARFQTVARAERGLFLKNYTMFNERKVKKDLDFS